MEKDTYLTIASPSRGEYKDRGSKFLAYAFPLFTENDWQLHLDAVRKEHPKARHHCYAFRIGRKGDNFRANDAGEPSGTAGRPILGQIDSFQLTNVLVVVARYFGGTLLGTSGLINAYKGSAHDALQQAEIIEKRVEDVFRLRFDYAIMGDLMNVLKKLDVSIICQEFNESPFLDISLPQSERDKTLIHLKAGLAKVSPEEAEAMQEIEGLTIEFLFTT